MSAGGRSKSDPRYGRGEVTIALDEADLLDEAALGERMRAVFSDPAYRPPTLPSVAMELLELSRRSDVSADAVVALLEHDSVLAGRVLKTAQSPVFGAAGGRIQSLRDALVRLGLRALRDLVLEAAMNLRVFRSPAYADGMERLSRHSMATAYLSRLVARQTALADEYAFLCGLLHDVGIAGILIACGDAARGKAAPELARLWPAIDAVHEEAGAAMARIWGLPEEIPLVISAHHHVVIDGFEHPLAATVCLADALAAELGAGLGDEKEGDAGDLDALTHRAVAGAADRTSPRTLERAREALRLSDEQLALIRSEAETLLRESIPGS